MSGTFWSGGGCGYNQFCEQGLKPVPARRTFIEAHLTRDQWPHGDWDHIDPLIVPLVEWMNHIPNLQTRASCQGTEHHTPYVMFYADLEAAGHVRAGIGQWHAAINEGWYWNTPIITLEYDNLWLLHFYDTISLIKFTVEYLKVDLVSQWFPAELHTELRAILVAKCEDWRGHWKS